MNILILSVFSGDYLIIFLTTSCKMISETDTCKSFNYIPGYAVHLKQYYNSFSYS